MGAHGLEVLDARLAGEYKSWQLRFKLRYTHSQDRKIFIKDEETVPDISYLWHSSAQCSSERTLRLREGHVGRLVRKSFVQLKEPHAG